MHFHTVCMGIKLALCEQPFLRNLRIDELWETAQIQRVPRPEWRSFIKAHLVGEIPGRRRPLKPHERLLGAVGKLGGELKTAFARVGRDVGESLREAGGTLQQPLAPLRSVPLPRAPAGEPPAGSSDEPVGPDSETLTDVRPGGSVSGSGE